MNGQGIEHVLCRHCCDVVDAIDHFCRHCGFPLAEGGISGSNSLPPDRRPIRAEVVSTPLKFSGGAAKWSENPWVVLVLLFFVLGPLGLPMLWRSRRFSLLWKVLLTALIVAVTVFILAMVWYVTYQLLAQLRELKL